MTTKYDIIKSSKEFKLKGFKYEEYMTFDDEDSKIIKQFDSKDLACKYMQNLNSSIIKYEDNGLVIVEEYYIAENTYEGEEFIEGSLLSNIAPLIK